MCGSNLSRCQAGGPARWLESSCSQLHWDLFVPSAQMFTWKWHISSCALFSHPRPAADGGPHAVPCRLGFRQGDRLLRDRGLALQAGSLLARLGLLRSDRRNSGKLPVRCSVRTGGDCHLQWQSSGGDWGGEESHLSALSLQTVGGIWTYTGSVEKIKALLTPFKLLATVIWNLTWWYKNSS